MAFDGQTTKVTPIFAWNDYLLFFYNKLDDAAINASTEFQMRRLTPQTLHTFISLLSQYALNLQFDFFPWLEETTKKTEVDDDGVVKTKVSPKKTNLDAYAEHYDLESDKNIIMSIKPQDYLSIVYRIMDTDRMTRTEEGITLFKKLMFMHAIMKHWELGKGSKNNRKTFVDPRNALRYNSSTAKYGGLPNVPPKL